MKTLYDNVLMRETSAILTLYMGTILVGFNLGFSAIAIPDIKNEMLNTTSTFLIPNIVASNNQLSWFASSINIGQMVGALIGGYLGGRFGPKKVIQFHGLICSFGWLLMGFSPNLSLLIVGRLVVGFAQSLNMSNCSLLVAQYSVAKRRGAFLSMFSFMIGIGILCCYSLGAGVYWRYVSFVPTIFCLIMTISMSFIPESPIWLLSHEGEDKAKSALQWLRYNEDVTEELNDLRATREQQSHGLTAMEAVKNLSSPHVGKPFLIICVNFFLILFSGPFVLVFYIVEIYKDAGLDVNDYIAAIISTIVRICGGITGIFLARKLPRRIHSMISCTLMGVSLIILGAVFYLKLNAWKSPILNILPVICVSLFQFSYGSGAGPLQWVFVGELLPPEYKVLSGILVSINATLMFIIIQIFPTLVENLSSFGTYWIFASFALSCNVLYYFVLPETKDLSLLEIKQLFK